jgi:multicomponent Na+:H+ antiporter subunit E
MRLLVWNILLALVWVASTQPTGGNLALGFVLGYLILLLTPGVGRGSPYFRKVFQLIGFIAFYVKEVVMASLRISWDVLTPTHYMRPAVLAIPLELETPEEITVLALFISLTPGTLALDVSLDQRVLYVHAMYVTDVESIRHTIKTGYERRVLELLR